MAVLALIFKTLSVIFYTSAWWFYKPPPVSEDEDGNEQKNPTSSEMSVVKSPSIEAVPSNVSVSPAVEETAKV
jgi:hypothetical protein